MEDLLHFCLTIIKNCIGFKTSAGRFAIISAMQAPCIPNS